MPVPDMLEATLGILRQRRHQSGSDGIDDEGFRQAAEMIEREARRVRDLVKGGLQPVLFGCGQSLVLCLSLMDDYDSDCYPFFAGWFN